MLISVIQVRSFNPLCLVMAIQARTYIHTHTHTHTHTDAHLHLKPLELTANGHEAAFCGGHVIEARQQSPS